MSSLETRPSHVVVRGQLQHDEPDKTDLYVTKDSSIAGAVAAAERKIRDSGAVVLRATGAANYKALKVAVMLTKAHPGVLKTSVETSTIETRDFLVPTSNKSEQEVRERNLNAVAVTVSKL